MTVTPFPIAHARSPARVAPHRAIGIWLLVCAGLVFAMAVIGAITRLTESGLSITEWKPVTGALPPLSEAAWAEEFAKYQATPEFALKHSGMDVAQFKGIFFWEWFHRLLGRVIGLAFLLPFLFFAATRRVPRALAPRLVGLFVLGGLQGALGWYMVKSGLVNRPDVSHYRLAAHLSLAVLIYVAMLATAVPLLFPAASGAAHSARAALRRHAGVAMALVATTMVWGAFTAGLDAGQAYNTWPLMNGTLAPEEMWNLSPAWLNFLENTAAVQFTHRWLAILTGLVVWSYTVRALGAGVQGRVRSLAIAVAAMVLVQISLGISTLLMFVPVHVAATHQAGALVLLGLFTWTVMEYRRA
ncbi:COX15/CtaA family protein [Nitrospirillum iridis]|uniref:Heme A synthase n=1 Tax=Nitrospirillum iridis TaxID=765888 RepID=A0A7X0B0J3_9PROT|nr:COX15/CtaA family protein [Nitrospirillum iridis]MBB6253445.1 cytochrome c oxidase assembly protein subunit 15 [Nitrospirillum iridis]